MLAQTRM
jgi:hypothetical protein